MKIRITQVFTVDIDDSMRPVFDEKLKEVLGKFDGSYALDEPDVEELEEEVEEELEEHEEEQPRVQDGTDGPVGSEVTDSPSSGDEPGIVTTPKTEDGVGGTPTGRINE